MEEKRFKYIEATALSLKSKAELIALVLELQDRDKAWLEEYTSLYGSKREARKKHEEEIKECKKKLDEYLRLYAEADAKQESYKRIVDLKLGSSYNINATWIDKIVFVLKEAGRPLRSSEIIEILTKNDITFRTLTDKQKGLSAHLTKALKYGRIKGEKQKGQNGYLFRLP
jgi:undecaprenyl pyrophosphate synthase